MRHLGYVDIFKKANYIVSAVKLPKTNLSNIEIENFRFLGELIIFFQNPGDSRSFQKDLKFAAASRGVATLSCTRNAT